MRFSKAVTVLAISCVGNASAFQTTRSSSMVRRSTNAATTSTTATTSSTRRYALAIDPPAKTQIFPVTVPAPPKIEEETEIIEEPFDMTGIALGGLQGKALKWKDSDFPKAKDLKAVIPKDCFVPETKKSLKYLSVSVIGTTLCTLFGVRMLSVFNPAKWSSLPFWGAYSAVTGTVAMGLWVLAHECGHGAFSKNKTIQDTVGYCLHSLFLVPYYSWQRSHAVHHLYTNHMELGETHVPEKCGVEDNGPSLKHRDFFFSKFGKKMGLRLWGGLQGFLHLLIGWPAYLLIGATGSPDRGLTNHFLPNPMTKPNQPRKELFPGKWKKKVLKSDIGVILVGAAASALAWTKGLPVMMAIYGAPVIVVNAWLVLYTWCVVSKLFRSDTSVRGLLLEKEEANTFSLFLTLIRAKGSNIQMLMSLTIPTKTIPT